MLSGFYFFFAVLLSIGLTLDSTLLHLTADDDRKLISLPQKTQAVINGSLDYSLAIAAKDPSKTVTVDLQFNAKSSCSDNFVDVYDGPDKTSPFLGHYCTSQTITSHGHTLYLKAKVKKIPDVDEELIIQYLQNNDGLSGGKIAGIATGVISAIVFIIVMIGMCCSRCSGDQPAIGINVNSFNKY